MSEVVLVGLINGLAFWQQYLFLWFLACAANSAFGFYWASTGSPGEAVWVEGIVVVALGGFCLCRAMMIVWGRVKR